MFCEKREGNYVSYFMLSEFATGFPGYNSAITEETATIVEILNQKGKT